ncbi:uncharacterized protein NPIL_328451 [Nephila pilipes]|uniref:Uncharacterized protein n=1 Tax=Nephila pilipes TaxID=299642 RepID=A0A8X6NWC8_NEPPI|nr:uncharacterized protein NPIL_328451 [Nephila pilipes]
MRFIRRGADARRMFCAVMNQLQPPTRFAPYSKRVLNAVNLVAEQTIQSAVQVVIWENRSNKNIAIAVDGTCSRRDHQKYCKRNFESSSGSMEVEGTSRIFQSAFALHDVQYIT